VEDIDFLNGFFFVAGNNSNKLQNSNGFGRKNQLSPLCVHIAKFRKFSILKR
jgi:hypothetical protein